MEYFTVIKGICVILCILLMAFSGCVSDKKEDRPAPVTAAVTILPQQEFVEKVGGDRVDTIVMIPPGASPATYSPVPEEVRALSRADIYFKVGTTLPFEEVYLGRLIEGNPETVVINCTEEIVVIGNDPHVWTTPKNAIRMVDAIADGLSSIDPQNSTYYQTNAETYIDELNALDRKIHDILITAEGGSFLVYHPAWSYFAEEYSLTQIPIEKDGKEPGSRELAEIISLAKTEGLKTVYANPQVNTEPARYIADQIEGELVYADPLAKDYAGNLEDFAISLSGGGM